MLKKHVWSSRRPSDQSLKQRLGIRRKQIRIGALSFARSHRRIVKRDKERWESGLSRGGVSFFKDVTPGPPAERNPNAARQFYRRCRENRLRTRRFSRRRLDFLRGLQLSRHCLDNPRIVHVEGAYVEKNNGPPDNGGKRSEQGLPDYGPRTTGAGAYFAGRFGRMTRIVVPLPSALSASTRPPCSCAICFTMDRPRPVPPSSRLRARSAR